MNKKLVVLVGGVGAIHLAAAGLLLTSCGSKKELVNCQTENKSLTESLMAVKEDLAAKNARVSSGLCVGGAQ